MKKLLGRTDVEDALKRLDKLTHEEALMATAQVLKVAHRVDDKVTSVDGKVTGIDDKVTGVDDKVTGIDSKMTGIDDKLTDIDNKVDVVIDGEKNDPWLAPRLS